MLHYNATCDYISALYGALSEGIRTRNAAPPAVEEVEENGRKLPEVRMPKYNTIQSTNTKYVQILNRYKYKYTLMHKYNAIQSTNTKTQYNTISYKV